MKALLIVAHGSRRVESNDEVRELIVQMRQRAGNEYGDVRCAFLELAEPSIPDGIVQCVAQGVTEVVVLPYFLSAGRHVAKDIPELVAQAQAKVPHVKVRIAPYLGLSAALVDVLLGMAAKHSV